MSCSRIPLLSNFYEFLSRKLSKVAAMLETVASVTLATLAS